jgi:hypothetical protein
LHCSIVTAKKDMPPMSCMPAMSCAFLPPSLVAALSSFSRAAAALSYTTSHQAEHDSKSVHLVSLCGSDSTTGFG